MDIHTNTSVVFIGYFVLSIFRMSLAEKVAHGVVLTAGIFAVPTWILVHVKEYRGTS